MAAPLILIEAQPRNAGTGAVVTTRLAGGGGAKPYFYAGQHWRAGLTGLPTIVASIDFNGTDLGTGSVPQAMSLRWAPSTTAALAEVAELHWIDAVLAVRIGPEGALPPVLTNGKVIDTSTSDGVLTLTLSDPAADLKQPILKDRFLGTGGIEGPIEWEGRIKRRVWGRVFNLEGDPIDVPNNIYCFGDPTRAWAEFVTVRDKGATASGLAILPWQGTVAATFTALQAAVAPAGGGVVCPSIACVKWWTRPAGSLCADVRGEVGSGYVETAPAIAERIVAAISAVQFAAGTVAAAISARPAVIGWVADDETGTAAAALDALLGDVSLLWALDDDMIVLREWAWGASVAAARSLTVSRKATFKPVVRRRLGYRRNDHVMTRDAIAGIVFATDVMLGDGSTVENLQSAVAAAQASADAAIAAIATIASDNILSRGSEKQRAVIDWEALTADRSALDDRFTALGSPPDIAAAHAAMGTAVDALAAYLATLVPDWDEGADDTPIVAATWVANWSDAYRKVATFRAIITGRTGPAGLTGWLTNESHTLGADAAGNVTDYTGASGFFVVFSGANDVSAYFTLATKSGGNPQGLVVSYSDQEYIITGGLNAGEASASLTIEASGVGPFAGIKIEKVFSLGKSPAGADGSPAKLISISPTSQMFSYDKAGVPRAQTVTIRAYRQNIATATAWRLYNSNGTPRTGYTTAAGLVAAMGGTSSPDNDTVIIDEATFGPRIGDGDGKGLIFEVTADGLSDRVTILKIQDGADGVSAILPYLENEATTVSADAAGNVLSYADANGQFRVLAGPADVTASFTFGIPAGGNPQGLTGPYSGLPINAASGAYSVTGGFDAAEPGASLTMRASGTGTYAGLFFDKKFTLAKSKTGGAGGTGADAKLIKLNVAPRTFRFDKAGAIIPQTVTYTVSRQNTAAAVTWRVLDKNGTDLTGALSATALAATGFWTRVNDDTVTMSHAQFAALIAGAPARETLTMIVSATDGDVLTDRESISKVADGADGAGAKAMSLTVETMTFNTTYLGVVYSAQYPKTSAVTTTEGTAPTSPALNLSISDTTNIDAAVASGVVSVTRADAEGWVDVLAAGYPTRRISIKRQADPPPAQNATSISGSVSSNIDAGTGASSFTGTPNQAALLLTAGSSGQLQFSGFAEYFADTPVSGVRRITAKAQCYYRLASGGGWSVAGTSSTGTQASALASGDGTSGSISFGATITGLTNGVSYQFAVELQRQATTGFTGAQVYGDQYLGQV